MQARELRKLDADLTEFVEELFAEIGRVDRRSSLRMYVTGLLLDGERKSMEPMARRLVKRDAEVDAMRQRLQECVTTSQWSEDELFARLARKVDSELPGVEAFVLDDTGFPKKGTHSVGVERQYAGVLGRVDNCQVGVSLHLASERGSSCIAMDLYLPASWTEDRARCRKAGVPDDVLFRTKWQMGLEQLDAARGAGIRDHVVLADAGFGDIHDFRAGLAERGLRYVVGVQSAVKVWAPSTGPEPPIQGPGIKAGRPRTRFRTGEQKPMSLVELATSLGEGALKTLTWREGSRGPQRSRFGAVRVRTAHHHARGKAPGDELWLVWSWPQEHERPTKFWFSNMPASTSVQRLVYLAKLRWRVERDYQEMKGEVGLDHYEGRTWRGWHHHTALVAMAHAFLTLQRVLSPPIDVDDMDAS